MYKVWYDEKGFVCERYPLDIKITNEDRFLEVSPDDYYKTLISNDRYAWKVVEGKLQEVEYRSRIKEEIESDIRNQRLLECFPIINRGNLWYSTLTEEKLEELKKWYLEWLEAPETLIVPNKPEWLE